MKRTLFLTLLMALSLVACSSRKDKERDTVAEAEPAAPTTLTSEQVAERSTEWDPQRKEVLNRLVEKYGQPNEATDSMFIWNNNEPWAKTILYSADAGMGSGMLEQYASLDVPPEKLSDIALFNRSVTVDRENSMISSRADREELNFLSLNLSKEIVDGKMSPMEARRQYTQLSNNMQRGQFMDDLNFGSRRGTGAMDDRSSDELQSQDEVEEE